MIPLALWWSTWKERNHQIFMGNARSYQELILYVLRTLYSWSQVLDYGTNLTFLDFVDKINLESIGARAHFVSTPCVQG